MPGASIKYEYSSFMTQGFNQENKTRYCKASAKITDTTTKRVVLDEFIDYSVRYTDNGDEIYVEVDDNYVEIE